LAILTTNNFPDQVQALTKQLEQKNYLSELYYTSPEGFQEAMKWYDAILTEEANQQEENKNQAEAAGKGAIAVLQKVFAKRDTMDPGEFIMEMVRLAFQSGASDLHFQSEVAGVFMRIRVDGVLETVEQFTHEEFVKFLQKMKFIS
jgi:type II secretory ATPase GspE/PulE/Tfp pilus assembly ATPase PilB-like protein